MSSAAAIVHAGKQAREENSRGKFQILGALSAHLQTLIQFPCIFMDKYNVDGAFLLILSEIILAIFQKIPHFYATDAND